MPLPPQNLYTEGEQLDADQTRSNKRSQTTPARAGPEFQLLIGDVSAIFAGDTFASGLRIVNLVPLIALRARPTWLLAVDFTLEVTRD